MQISQYYSGHILWQKEVCVYKLMYSLFHPRHLNPLPSLSAQHGTTSLNIIHVNLHLCHSHSLSSLMQSRSLLSRQDRESCYMDQGPFSATKAS